jgi:hypothetical protein
VQQQHETHQADEPGNAAGDHGQKLLGGRRQPDGVPQLERGQEADQVPEEDAEDADVKQVGPEAQLTVAQKLRRIALPRVLVAVEADETPHEEHREGDVGIDAEQERMNVGHAFAPGIFRADAA